ncbi:MAG: dynamin family protein [Deltaproteobacteria bacterium]|nr:dynamin family protein [Deltaproteobacteria bacterium]
MLDNYIAQTAEAAALWTRLAELAGKLGMTSLRDEITKMRLPKLQDGRFNLVVLGEFNHGKSTFVNALLGEALLPTGITPTTATINHIVWAEQPQARVVRMNGESEVIDPEKLAEYVTLGGKQAEGINFVEVGYPIDLLKEHITLVDTPGVNDINLARAEVTYGYIPRADAVIFLLDGTQVLKQSERTFLQQRLLQRSRDKLLFVVGKADLLSKDELKETTEFAHKHLSALVDEPTIFAVSARSHLDAKTRKKSGMDPLLEHLKRYLNEERGRILVDNAVADAQHTAQYLHSSIGLKRGSLELSLEELTARVAGIRKELAGSQAGIREHLERINAEAEATKATIRHDLRLFCDEFCRVLPAQIDGAEASDVKKYLQFFIQDKFKEWAELEGDKVAELLEKLAEEIIAVTNENVRGVLDRVSSNLNPRATRVELDVDTLKYDASVFAVGALGTTIFLFVNTFVGGLLTIAAPILAVALRTRADGMIKTQAKEKAPEVIRAAADAVRPKFEEIVDRFAEQLADFVTSAGDALTRGVSEVLDQTLAERQSKSSSSAQLGKALETQEAELEQIVAELADARQRLWQ